jgi:uncharacterized membrane protein
MSKPMKGFIAAIALMGVVRFVLDRGGLPIEIVKYFSMSVIIFAGFIYFAITTDTHKERLKASFLLIMPYMIVEVLALGYTWASGNATIFHAKEYSFGSSIAAHTVGHFVGGLTWEPLFGFLLMEAVWFVYSRIRRKPVPAV